MSCSDKLSMKEITSGTSNFVAGYVYIPLDMHVSILLSEKSLFKLYCR